MRISPGPITARRLPGLPAPTNQAASCRLRTASLPCVPAACLHPVSQEGKVIVGEGRAEKLGGTLLALVEKGLIGSWLRRKGAFIPPPPKPLWA